ncbi:hypothetical protein HRI_001041900 [Hibiscus trionum]|uniref:TF-B3 domain-containing protein n=1 Tax=Hibiscus trionum TaxID=183268 RepID=A0A9W7HA40_HIBTR|nr:hypothetical protein HRI_001041900 [Hibiscus trionum]
MLSKLLTKTDVEKSLEIPACGFDALPFQEGHCFYMNVADNNGSAWTFPCFIQPQKTGGDEYQSIGSSVVSVGWMKFATKIDLRVGDMVVLHHQSLDVNSKGSNLQFRIEVRRKIRLLGQDIWTTIDHA